MHVTSCLLGCRPSLKCRQELPPPPAAAGLPADSGLKPVQELELVIATEAVCCNCDKARYNRLRNGKWESQSALQMLWRVRCTLAPHLLATKHGLSPASSKVILILHLS